MAQEQGHLYLTVAITSWNCTWVVLQIVTCGLVQKQTFDEGVVGDTCRTGGKIRNAYSTNRKRQIMRPEHRFDDNVGILGYENVHQIQIA